jgi:hypothetical protein
MFLFKLAVGASLAPLAVGQVVNSTSCNGKNYTYQGLAGFDLIPGNTRGEFGDTIGGIGSAIALDRSQWKKLANGSYTSVLWGLPDRGWSVERSPPSIRFFECLCSKFVLGSLMIR